MDPIQIALAAVVFMLMLGLGATLSVQEVKKTLKKWKPLCVGMLSQFGLMPLVAFCFALALDAPNHLGLGMVLMGSAPGGSTSNLFTYWSKGDLALSISMTVVSTTCALFMMPLLLLIYSSRFSDDDIKPDYVSTVLALAIVLVPVGLGVFFNTKWPKCGKRLALVANIVGVIFIIAAIVVGSVTETHIFDADWRTWLAAIFMLIIAAAFGYFLCFLFRQSPRVRRTVALETGIQNATLVIAIVTLTFPEGPQRTRVLVFPLLYSLWIVIDGLILSALFHWVARKEAQEASEEEDQEEKEAKEDSKEPGTIATKKKGSDLELSDVKVAIGNEAGDTPQPQEDEIVHSDLADPQRQTSISPLSKPNPNEDD